MLNGIIVYDIVPALSGYVVPGEHRAIKHGGQARETSLTSRLPVPPYPVSYGRHGQRAIRWLQWLIVAAILLRRLWLRVDPARRKAIRGAITALVVIVAIYAVVGSVLLAATALGGVDGLITAAAMLIGLVLLLVMVVSCE